VRGAGVGCDMVVGVGVVRGVVEVELSFERVPLLSEAWRWEVGAGGGGVGGGLNEVKVTANKGVDARVRGVHGVEKAAIEDEVTPRFHVDVEELKRLSIALKRSVDA
jgi:hypothetical protein